jgi:hypothetical protein
VDPAPWVVTREQLGCNKRAVGLRQKSDDPDKDRTCTFLFHAISISVMNKNKN